MAGVRPSFAGLNESENPGDAPRASARKRQEGGSVGGTWVPPACYSVIGWARIQRLVIV